MLGNHKNAAVGNAAIISQCMSALLAHRVISLRRKNRSLLE